MILSTYLCIYEAYTHIQGLLLEMRLVGISANSSLSAGMLSFSLPLELLPVSGLSWKTSPDGPLILQAD